MRSRWLFGLVAAACVSYVMVAPTAAEQQRGGGQGGQGRGGEGRPQMTPEQMREMIEKRITERLQQSGVTEAQMPAVKEALKVKQEARDAYRKKLGELATELDEKSKDAFVADQDLLDALAACKKAQQAAEADQKKAIAEQDAKIIALVGPMTQVKLFLAGILDNGGVFVPREGGGFGGFGGGFAGGRQGGGGGR